MALTRAEVVWVAQLARLDLSDAELDMMTQQLGAIVEYVDQLRQIDTKGVEPLAHALAVESVFRDDEAGASLPVTEALANAPDHRTDARGQHFYGVPAVLD
jgi:aspartyl-tRNA(Asn)/glutamyl-tRNA(Gln) amidotransferase subunit C